MATAVLKLVLVFSLCNACFSADFKPVPLTVPEGFTVELAAGPPLVKYPMMGCFDERGRLLLAESLLREQCRFIRMLEDTDYDGQFDKSTIFADKLVMPEGALWHQGSLYVLSSPYLWKFTDTDDDGVADVREKLVGEMDFNGKANQHGAYLGPTGRIYFSGGIFGYDLTDKHGKAVAKGNAAAVFSCRADGTDVQVFGNGGINPVEVAFSPEGDLFTTCPIFDSIGGRHDAMIHWVRGSTAGPRDYAAPVLKQTGYRIPSVRRWGQVAPSGLMRYRSQELGQEYRNTYFATHFNTATVVNTKLQRIGSTFEGRDTDFVTSTNRDFHPTDVIEDADGSLLVIDTGGWFLISCPYSKVAKPEALGAIYRIRRTGAHSVDDPRGLDLNWGTISARTLVRRLDDKRPAVRSRAIAELARRGHRSIDALEFATRSGSTQLRRNAIWALSRIESLEATQLLRVAFQGDNPSVQQAAARSAGVLRDQQCVPELIKLLGNDSMQLRQAAATALGEIGDTTAVKHLFEAITLPGDDHLYHALVYALIEIGHGDSIRKGLAHTHPRVQHAALVSLQAIEAPMLAAEVTPLLASTDKQLRMAAQKLVTSREEWSGEIAKLLTNWLQSSGDDSQQNELAVSAMVTLADNPSIRDLIQESFGSQRLADTIHFELLKVVERLRTVPDAWLLPLTRQLARQGELQEPTIHAIATSGSKQFDDQLTAIASYPKTPGEARLAAWLTLAQNGETLSNDGFGTVTGQLLRKDATLDRLAAARAITTASLTGKQLEKLADFIPELGSSEQSMLLDALALRAKGNRELSERVAKLHATHSTQKQSAEQVTTHVSTVLKTLAAGDAAHGRNIFYSNRAACSSCHRVNGEGGNTGPDLSKIGSVRRRPDLLEAIMYPSSTIVNSFETYIAVTHDGLMRQGVIERADSQWLVLRDDQRRQIVIARNDIESLKEAKQSLMPKGLEANLNRDELSDLLAYLQSLQGN